MLVLVWSYVAIVKGNNKNQDLADVENMNILGTYELHFYPRVQGNGDLVQ